MKLPHSKMLCK